MWKIIGIIAIPVLCSAWWSVRKISSEKDEEDGYSVENFKKPKKKSNNGFAMAAREMIENTKSADIELIKASERMKQMGSGEL